MNAQFEQWVNNQGWSMTEGITRLYNHLQANPHLLREDEEKEPTPYNLSSIVFGPVPPTTNHRENSDDKSSLLDKKLDTDNAETPDSKASQQIDLRAMAEEVYNKSVSGYGEKWYIEIPLQKVIKAALTEALQQGCERGREELSSAYLNLVEEVIPQLQQQLVEKDKAYKELLKFAQNKEVSNLRIDSELAAAKADHEINISSTAQIDLKTSVPTVIVTIEILNTSKRMLVINTEGKSMPVAYTDTLTIERKIGL